MIWYTCNLIHKPTPKEDYHTVTEELEKNRTSSETTEEPALPKNYPGSGLNKNPARMMKIEEVVEWDMEFGVKIGPVGYDHRLTCPYCRKRMLLVSHEGSRHQKFIRILYQCENCGAHTVVQYHAPNQKVELPELSLGEKIIIEKPTPVPNTAPEGTPQKDARNNERNRKNRSQPQQIQQQQQPLKNNPPSPVSENRSQSKPMQPPQQDLRKKRPQDSVVLSPAPLAKQPLVKLPGEQIKKLAPNSANPMPSHQPPAQQPEKKSNAYFRSRKKNNPNHPRKTDN